MSLIAKQNADKEYPIVDAGNHHAICYGVIDLGTQYNSFYEKSAHKILFLWELPQVRIEVERDGVKVDLPRAISKKYTASLHEKASMFNDISSWRGIGFSSEELEGFDARVMAGCNCLLNIAHKQGEKKIFAYVAAITPLLVGMKHLDPENPVIKYDIDEDGWEVPDSAPGWITDVVKESYEYKEAHKAAATDISEDDIPF